MKYKTKGFTLLELAIVITVLTILAVATMPQIAEDYNRTRTHLTIGEIESFSEAARLYAHNNKGAWPDAPQCNGAIQTLTDKGYLKGVDQNSPWKTLYKTSCTDKIFTITTNVSKQHEDWAGVILNAVHSTNYDQTQQYVVHTNVVLPGGVPATRELLHRKEIKGSPELNTMETAINMNDQDLQKVRDITQVRDITLMGKIVDGSDPDAQHYLDPDQKSVMRNLELSTLKATHMSTQYGYAEQGTTGSYGYVAYDGRNNPNRNPKSEVGSINVNDILLRSGGKSGRWLSELDKNTHVLLSMYSVAHRNIIDYPRKEDCTDKGGDPRIVVIPGGYWEYIYNGATPPGHHVASKISAKVESQVAKQGISAFPETINQGWRIYFYWGDNANNAADEARGLAQVYCAY